MTHDSWLPDADAIARTIRPTVPVSLVRQWAGQVGVRDRMCRSLLVALADSGDAYGRITISGRGLAQAAGTTTRTVRTHSEHLVAWGLIILMRRGPSAPQVPVDVWLTSPLPPLGGGR